MQPGDLVTVGHADSSAAPRGTHPITPVPSLSLSSALSPPSLVHAVCVTLTGPEQGSGAENQGAPCPGGQVAEVRPPWWGFPKVSTDAQKPPACSS